jgi:glucokinase
MRGSGYSSPVRASGTSSPQGFRAESIAILEEIVEQFLAKAGGPVQRACLAVAGPVSEGRVAATNLAWIVDAGGLARVVGLDMVHLKAGGPALLGGAEPDLSGRGR